jgi:hypothetical protein
MLNRTTMKNYTKTLLAFAALLCIGLSSCMDNVDMDNLSTDMRLGGKLALPLGSSEFTMKDLLARYKPDSLIKVEVDEKGVVMLCAENIVDYKTPDLSEQFGKLVDSMMKFSVKTQPLVLENVGFPISIVFPQNTIIAQDTTMQFNFNSLNQDNTVQEITRILFKKTNIKVRVETSLNKNKKGFLIVTMQIPGTTDSIVIDACDTLTEHKKTNLMIMADKKQTTDYKIKFKITGNGETSISPNDRINISIAFEDSEFVVYGYFYYSDGKKQMQPYHVDLFSFLPEGTDLKLYAPSIKFDIASNIGIPFIFNLDTITSYIHGEPEPTYVETHLVKDSVINRSTELGVPALSTITIDKSTFPDDNASAIFNTKLDSLSTGYIFKAPMFGSSLVGATEQFIGSDSWMRLTANVQMPFWLDSGSVITYADTIESEDLTNEYITSASLTFRYTSKLPLGFEFTVKLLDKDKKPVEVSAPEKYRYNIKAAPVDAYGDVAANSRDGEFIIEYDANTVDELKKAKYVVINLKATGATPQSRIKIMNTNSLKISAELRTEGGLTVEN